MHDWLFCGTSAQQWVIQTVRLCRFDECGISPLTVKALSSAGYVQMTRIQEASLPICLEGMLSFFFQIGFLQLRLPIQFIFVICCCCDYLLLILQKICIVNVAALQYFISTCIFQDPVSVFCLLVCFCHLSKMTIGFDFDDYIALQGWMLQSKLKLALEKVQLFWYTLFLLCLTHCIVF